MGKPSKLRQVKEVTESRYSDVNGKRKLYDRDKPPEGVDVDIWHLALLFDQKAEELLVTSAGRPIIYTELSHRIIQSGLQAHDDWIDLAERMITEYWDKWGGNAYPLNEFCGPEIFDYYRQWVLDTLEREDLLIHAVKKSQRRVRSPARNDTTDIRILSKKYEEDELLEKIKNFKGK